MVISPKPTYKRLSNEYELGDFGMGGMHLKRGGDVTPSKIFMESPFVEATPPYRPSTPLNPNATPPVLLQAAGSTLSGRHYRHVSSLEP